MKISKIWLAIVVIFITLSSACTKKSNTISVPKPEINPIKHTESQTVYSYRYLNSGYTSSYEHGITFSSNTNGKITKVGGKVYKAANYRITVWDDSTKNILNTTYVDLDSTDYKYVNITPISVLANKRYVISINVLKYAFEIRDNTVSDFMPFYTNGITIHYYSDAKTSNQTFPDRFTYTYKMAGLVDFTFVAD